MTDEPNSAPTHSLPESPKWHVVVRLLLIGAIVCFAAAVGSTGVMRVCEENLNSQDEVVKLCRPAGPTDVRYVSGLVAVLLLLPGMSEVGVAGLLTIKRRVAEQQKRQDSLERSVALTQLQVASAITAVRQDVHVHNDLRTSYPPGQVQNDLARVEEAAASEGVEPGLDEQIMTAFSPEENAYRVALLDLWETLDRSLHLTAAARRGTIADELAELRARFKGLFAEEIETVRLVRNGVAHSRPDIPIDDLRSAVDIGATLNSIWLRRSAEEA